MLAADPIPQKPQLILAAPKRHKQPGARKFAAALADAIVRAAPGFNVIATANLRDRGVNEMSSALKRRFNFETAHPIDDPAFERELIARRLADRLAPSVVAPRMPDARLQLLVSTFQEQRPGRKTLRLT